MCGGPSGGSETGVAMLGLWCRNVGEGQMLAWALASLTR